MYDDLYVKDLRVISNASVSEMIIIDNIICSYALNLENGIPITPYSAGDLDFELEYIMGQLWGLRPYINSAEYLERKFGLSEFYWFLSKP